MVDLVMLSFSFSAGMATFFNPCGFVMLPAYISYYLGQDEGSTRNLRHGLLRGVQLGITVSAGFFTVFGGLGLLFSLIGPLIAPYIPWASVLIGAGLIALVLIGAGAYLIWYQLIYSRLLALVLR